MNEYDQFVDLEEQTTYRRNNSSPSRTSSLKIIIPIIPTPLASVSESYKPITPQLNTAYYLSSCMAFTTCIVILFLPVVFWL